MLNAYDLGVDERAMALLGGLAEDKQQAILQKLSEGNQAGTIRNASAYVASACKKPDALGIDERAAELLNKLPKQRQAEVLEKLRSTEGIKNPSAWVAKACLKDIPGPQQSYQQQWQPMQPQWEPAYGKGYGGKGYGEPQWQPQQQQQWEPAYAKGGYGGKADYGGKGYGVVQKGYGGKGDSGAYKGYNAGPSFAPHQPAGGKGGPPLDASANQLLQTLPKQARQEILQKLSEQTGVRNPSAWVAKAALSAGATKGNNDGDGIGCLTNLDAEAQELLAALPEDEQGSILAKLEEESLKHLVRNPSAWVAKAALKAGATPTRSRNGGHPSHDLDADAQAVLQTLPSHQQEEIMAKLEEQKAAGTVRNPSGWVVKAALRAGAQPAGAGQGKSFGKGPIGKSFGKGYSPY